MRSLFFILIIIFCSASAIAISDKSKSDKRTSVVSKINDNKIQKEISFLLKKENDIPNTKITVNSKNSVVEIIGKVDTRLQANRIIELASSIQDVIDVNIDKLEVASSKEFLSDALITAKAKGRIKYLSINKKISTGYKLHIETTNKIVHILGSVTDKKDIETIKAEINNIVNVESVKLNITCK